MELTPGMSALVTGGANGIGKAIGLALAKNGLFVTVVDFSEERGTETASLFEKENKKFHPDIDHPSAMFIKCDVTNTGDVSAAFEKHVDIYGGLDICVNSAGVGTTVKRFDEDVSDGINTWRRIININFVAVIDCTRIAIQTMRKNKKPGVIINLGSASGLYPMCVDPIYSASKECTVQKHFKSISGGRRGLKMRTKKKVGQTPPSLAKCGVVLFTRSCSTLGREGIRVNVLCPEFVDTGIISENNLADVKMVGGYLPMETVVEGAFELIKDESKAGACSWITNRRGTEYWPTPEEENKIWGNLVTKWQGKVQTELPTTKPDQAWSLLKDFCNLHKYLPSLSVCEKIEGKDEIPGCVRYCAGTMQPSGVNFWAKEKLISFDNTDRSYSYEVTESGIGVEGYVAKLQVVEGGVDNNDGCKIEWSFEFKPLEGFSEEGYIEILQHWIKEMAKKVEDGLVMNGH